MSSQPCGCDMTHTGTPHFCERHSFMSPHSSNIESGTFNPETNEMRLTFKRKGGPPSPVYSYVDVRPKDWDGLHEAESKGMYFANFLKESYRGVRV